MKNQKVFDDIKIRAGWGRSVTRISTTRHTSALSVLQPMYSVQLQIRIIGSTVSGIGNTNLEVGNRGRLGT